MSDASQPPTAPLESLILGREYLDAARRAHPPPTTKLEELRVGHSTPAFFLVGHSIELALKAFLLGSRVSEEELKHRRLGHNLTALLTRAQALKLASEVALTEEETATIQMLDGIYSAKELEYRVVGMRTFPPYALIFAVADKLCTGLLPFVERASGVARSVAQRP